MKNTKEILDFIKIFKPKLYKKLMHTGRLFHYIASVVDDEIEDVYYDTAYLVNIGFISLEEYLINDKLLSDDKERIIKRHIEIGKDYFERIEEKEIAEIIYNHHELHNGLGYRRELNTDKGIALLNIADLFIDFTTEYYNRKEILTCNEAIEGIFENYHKNTSLLDDKEINEIKKTLTDYHSKAILNV